MEATDTRRPAGYYEPADADARCPWCGDDARYNIDLCGRCGWDKSGDNGRGEGEWVLKLESMVRQHADGTAHGEFDGKYLVEYDPRTASVTDAGDQLLVTLKVTDDIEAALRFRDLAAARREWMRWDGFVRPDGRPSRPLVAFSVSFPRVPA
jgi:hypothetical protein